MKKKIISLLCTCALVATSFLFPSIQSNAEYPTYEVQVFGTDKVYGTEIKTNLFAGCICGFNVVTDKQSIQRCMNFTSTEYDYGGEPVMYVGDYSWDTPEMKLVEDTLSQFGGKPVCLMDVRLFKFDGTENVEWSDPGIDIKLRAGVPDTLREEQLYKDGREFAIVHVHDGVAEVIQDEDSDMKTITWTVDSFSVMALVYAPEGNIDNYLSNLATTATTTSGSTTVTGAASNDLDDVPKTGDISMEWNLFVKPSSCNKVNSFMSLY